MSISSRGVKIQKRGRNYWLLIILTGVELVFSFLLIVSLASNLLFPQRASAVAGVSAKLSYQGRLTDLSGNPLGGSGTNYCFRFSIYDAASAGTKLWPAGTPASTTVRVKDGVFNTDIGTADSLATLDFTANDTIYLNVEVNATATSCAGSWEQLDLRQRIDSVGFARSAEGVYSSLLRAPTGGTVVQIGTGAGVATPIFLNLDVKNTQEAVDASCTTNGQLWYNSADSRARVCQGSVIQDIVDNLLVKDEGVNQGRASTALDFTGGGVSASKGAGGVININIPDRIGGIAVNAASTVTNGSVVFSNSNGVTFGMAGSTVTASVAAGGGAAPVISWFDNALGAGGATSNLAAFNITASSHSLFLFPLLPGHNMFPADMTVSTMLMNFSISGSTATLSSSHSSYVSYGIYTLSNNNSSFGLLNSVASTWARAAASNNSTGYQGQRFLSIHSSQWSSQPVFRQGSSYFVGFIFSRSNAIPQTMGPIGQGVFSTASRSGTIGSTVASNTSMGMNPWYGVYTATTGAFPAAINLSQLKRATASANFVHHIIFNNIRSSY